MPSHAASKKGRSFKSLLDPGRKWAKASDFDFSESEEEPWSDEEGWEVEVVSMEMDAYGVPMYEVRWNGWERKLPPYKETNTTWVREGENDPVVEYKIRKWKRKQETASEDLAAASSSIELAKVYLLPQGLNEPPVLMPDVLTRTAEHAQGYKAKLKAYEDGGEAKESDDIKEWMTILGITAQEVDHAPAELLPHGVQENNSDIEEIQELGGNGL